MGEESSPTSGEVAGSDEAAPTSGDEKANEKQVGRAMRKLAENVPDAMVEITAMMGGMGGGHPLHRKMNEGHITKMLDLATQHDTNEYNLRKDQQAFDSRCEGWNHLARTGYFLVFVGLLVFILHLFSNQPAVLVPILTGIGGVVTGFLGGMGYAKTTRKSGGD